jgi:hypothetical protein
MSKSFNFAEIRGAWREGTWKEPKVFMRAIIGALLLLNLIGAGFAFHLFGRSAEELSQELSSIEQTLSIARAHLNQTRQISGKVEKARVEGEQFLTSYMTLRRTTYSTVLSELQRAADAAGMTLREQTMAPLDPIKGSDDLSMMTITASFEGTYASLMKFVNLLDRSPRFMIIETLQAAPQPNGKALMVTMKVNTFVRGDTEDAI